MSTSTASLIKSYKISSFKDFFKRLYSEHKYHKTFSSLSHKLSHLLLKLKRVSSEQNDSFLEIASINYESQEEFLATSSQKPSKNSKTNEKNSTKSPLSTIVEQSDQNISDSEDTKTLENVLNEVFSAVDRIIPNENKIINQYKLELKNLAMEFQELEENKPNYREIDKKSSENLELFKKLYEKESHKVANLSKKLEEMRREFEKLNDFLAILQSDKEKLLKELDKEKRFSYKLQQKHEKSLENCRKGPFLEDSQQKLLEKDNFIENLQKQVKSLQTNLTKSRSDLALANESRISAENELKMLRNVKELLEKEHEKLQKTLEKKEKFLKETLIKAENPAQTVQKLQQFEEMNESLRAELKKNREECEELKTQSLELQFLNRNLCRKEEILDLKHKIDQLEYQNLLKDEENERIKANSLEKIDNLTYLLETDKKRIRELEESLLRISRESKAKEEETQELREILQNYSELSKDFKGIKKKLFA